MFDKETKMRIDRLERRVDIIEPRVDWAGGVDVQNYWSLLGRMDELEAKLRELERRAVKRDMALGMDYEQVHPSEMNRLRSLDRIVKDLLLNSAPVGPDCMMLDGPTWRRLKEALNR